MKGSLTSKNLCLASFLCALAHAYGSHAQNFQWAEGFGSGVFTEIDQGFIGVERSSVAWGNYDNDGDLSVLITGTDDQGDVNTVLYSSLEDINGFNLPPNIDSLTISSSADQVVTRLPSTGMEYECENRIIS